MFKTERVEFDGAYGDRLAARLEKPAGPVRAWAIFAHCFSCSKDIMAASRISRRLAARGIAVLRFDFTGLGHSDGEFANTNFSSNIEDLVKAAEYLSAEHGAPGLLIGHSLGGAAVIMAAHRLPSVKAVAVIGAPSSSSHVAHQFGGQIAEIEDNGAAEVSLGGRPFTIKKQFLDDIAGHNVEEAAATLKRPLLIAHSPLDATVGIDNATKLFIAAKHPKSFISLDAADHLLSKGEDADHAADVIAAWADRYAAEIERRDPPKPDREGGVVVAETGAGLYANHVVDGAHVLRAGEPESVGGDDYGPSPYGYLKAALAACTSMTLRMYAQRKKLPVERIEVIVRHEKDEASRHLADCAQCTDGSEGRIDVFDKTILIEGDLTEEQRARMLEIAERCPVHRTLNSPVAMTARLAGQGELA